MMQPPSETPEAFEPEASSPSLSYILVNFLCAEHVDRNLEALAGLLEDRDVEVLLVDNDPPDLRVEHPGLARFSRARRIANPTNVGFARAVNQALAVARGQLVLVANPDTLPLPGAVARLVEELRDHPEAALVGPCILGVDGRVEASARRFPSARSALFGRRSLLTRILPRNPWTRAELLARELATAGSTSPVDWVSGAFFLARRSALQEVGGFDEGYFLYWEDADLCRRLHLAGYATLYAPRARVVHFGRGSSRHVPNRASLAFHRSAYRYYRTHGAAATSPPRRAAAMTLLTGRFLLRSLLHLPRTLAGRLLVALTHRARAPGVLRILGRLRRRARSLLRASTGLDTRHYATWRSIFGEATPELLRALARAGTHGPQVRLALCSEGASSEEIRRSVRSLQRQSYPAWVLRVSPRVARLTPDEPRVLAVDELEPELRARALTGADDQDLVGFLHAGDQLAPCALDAFVACASLHPEATVLYADEELPAPGGGREPWFKPDFDRELLRSRDYLSGAALVRAHALRATPRRPVKSEYGLWLDLTAEGPRPAHVPHALIERAPPRPALLEARAARRRASLLEHLDGRGEAPRSVTPAPEWPGGHRVVYPLPHPLPHVTIVVPTRDRRDLLETCLGSLRARTRYPSYDILVVDNGSEDPGTLRYLEELAATENGTVLAAPGPFNFSHLNNRAAHQARGDLVCFLNNDTEVQDAGWLEELVAHAVRPGVGAVGARLWYPDGTLQHAGVVLGAGHVRVAGHYHGFLPRGVPGHGGLAVLTREVSAVTAACMVMRRELFLEVGGFDEEHLPVSYNDVDLCLRLRRAGLRILWSPYAELLHHESVSVQHEDGREPGSRFSREVAVMRERWGAELLRDPYLSPNLSPAHQWPRLEWSPSASLQDLLRVRLA